MKGGTESGLALFAGGGGLELGLSLAIGKHYRPIAYVEREATSAAVLAANMERGWLDKAPVWDDITTFTGDVVGPLVDNIDIVTAGFPCQPWSVAGQRKGADDERWLWPLIFRLVCEIRPRSIFLENVPGLLHGGIEYVLGDLASVGFDAEWASIRASDVGAPHRRERIFILAYSNRIRSTSIPGRVENPNNGFGISTHSSIQTRRAALSNASSSELGIPSSSGRSAGSDRSEALGDTPNLVSQRQQPEGARTGQPEEAIGDRSGNVDDTDSQGLQRWGRYSRSGNEWIAWPPSPSDYDAWERVDERFYPAQPSVRGMANGMAGGLARNDRLRILGNGVVPQQAALAYTLLTERLNNPK